MHRNIGLKRRYSDSAGNLGIDLKEFKLRGEFPYYEFYKTDSNETYCFDVIKGCIYGDNKLYGSLPDNLQTHPLLIELQLSTSVLGFKKNNEIYIKQDTGDIRIHTNCNNLVIHKEWSIRGKKSWYELRTLNSKQRRLFQSSNAICQHHLPKALNDGSTFAWVEVNGKNAFLAQKNNPSTLSMKNKK